MADPCQGIMDQRHFEAYQEPPCLWKLVEEHVPPEERLEIKSILGEAMVDLSLELHAEVETLMAMWRDERGRFLSLSEAQNQLFSPVLADPPTVKEMLRQEINLLLLDIRQKAREQGRDENKALQIYNQDVVNFAMGASRARSRANQSGKIASRPGSALSIRDGQEVPIRPLTGGSMADDRPASSLSSSSSLGDYMETIADKLNLLDINEAVIHLQSTLKEECRMLEQDCNFLQTCLEEEHHYNSQMESPHREPTVAELKEERRIIERDLHLSSPVPNALISSKVPVHGPILPIFRRAEFNQRVKLDDSHSRGVICELVHVSSHISFPFSDVKCSKSLGKTQLKVSRSFSGSLDHLVVQSSDVLRSQNDCSAGRSSYRVSIPISEDTEFTEINQSHGMSEKLHSEKVISKGIDLTRSKKRIPHVDQMREKSRTQDPCHTAPFPLSFKIGLTPHRTLQATDVVLAPTPPPVQRPALKPSSSIRRGRLIQQDNVAS